MFGIIVNRCITKYEFIIFVFIFIIYNIFLYSRFLLFTLFTLYKVRRTYCSVFDSNYNKNYFGRIPLNLIRGIKSEDIIVIYII